MEFKQTTIAPAGRNKYGNYQSSGNITKSVVSTTYAGNDTTTTIADNGQQEDTGTTNFYCILSQTNAIFNGIDLVQGATAATQVIAYRGYDKAITYVMDMDSVTAVTEEDGTIISLTAPANFGIRNIPVGMSASSINNGTSASTIVFSADSNLTGNSGSMYVPVCVYKRSDNVPNPDDLYNWYEHKDDCEIVWLEFVWNVNRSATSNYVMDLSNQMAGVNVSATTGSGDILYPNSIATLTCTASTRLNAELVSGITYSISTQPRYNARGVDIVNSANTGVLKFTSAGTNSFNFTGPTLPIDIVATLNGENIATKTMTINKNYPGGDGTPAHTRYIVTSHDAVVCNPNDNPATYSPTAVTGTVMLQVGDREPEEDLATTIYQWYNDLETGKTSATGSITATPGPGINSITFALKNSNDVYYEIEEVPVMSQGLNGASGAPGTSGVSGESAWYLTLDNDNASINCDSSGNILPGAIRPSCSAKLYYGSTRKTNATYVVDWGTASGITSAVSSGILTLSFGSGFDFTGDTLSISVSGISDEVRDVKIMNITKSYAGENGDDAVTYWIQTSFGEVIYNPNTKLVNPSTVLATAFKQVGQGAVMPAADATLYCSWGYRTGSSFTAEVSAETPTSISVSSAQCETYSRIRLVLRVGQTQVDQEDIDLIKEGMNGEAGQGRAGAAIRGPYWWDEYSATTRCWCAGESGNSCTECEKWIDVIYKDGTYYYCSTTYYGSLSPWNNVKSNWTSGETFDFIATRLLLAQNASIDFLTNNELYLRDGNGNITGGAAGGSGITFWAGAENPSDAPFQVDAQGNIIANKGIFAGYIQYPYINLGGLNRDTDGAYLADGRANLIADQYLSSYYYTNYAAPQSAHLKLPEPSSGLNGFTYHIVIYPDFATRTATRSSEQKAILSVVTRNFSQKFYVAAFASDNIISSTMYKRLEFYAGHIEITCMPRGSYVDGDWVVEYLWVVTNCTGGLAVYNNTTLYTVSGAYGPIMGYSPTDNYYVPVRLQTESNPSSSDRERNTIYITL